MNGKKEAIDTNKLFLSVMRGEPFEKSGLKDTKENQEMFRIMLAETDKMMRDGVDPTIPV